MRLHHRMHKTDACPGRHHGSQLAHPPGEYLNVARGYRRRHRPWFTPLQDHVDRLSMGQTLWLYWQVRGSLDQYRRLCGQVILELCR